MAFKLASLFVEIGGDDSALNRTLGAIRGKLGKLAATRFNVPGGGFLAALGIGAGVAGVGKAIKGASDLAETMSKVGMVFGDQADQVTRAADEMAKAFGVPKREFLDAASMFGLIAEGMGKSKEEAAGFSVRMAKLALDASSLHNIDVPAALEKIRAGLTGESEPLKALGVIMDETTMKAYALSHGIAKQGQEMNNAQKLAARMALIEQGLATSQGDLERTAGGASNQIRKFWGSLTNLGDTLGATILPSFTKFVTLLNEVATDMSVAATAGQGAWTSFFESFSSGFEVASAAYQNFGDIVERTGVMIGGEWDKVTQDIAYVGEVVKVTGKYLWESMVEAFNVIQTAASNMVKNVINSLLEILKWAMDDSHKIEIKIHPLLEGMKFKGDGKLVLPEHKYVDNVKDRLDAIDKGMQDRADARGGNAKVPGAPGAPGVPAGAIPGTTAAGTKGGVTDIDAYARELTEGALGSKDVAKESLDVQKSIDTTLKDMKKQQEQFDSRNGREGSWA